ncbi:exopolysaccharide Pel transporter PelG [Eubacteriaceae bacterium ES3]|nr:exopolysaccharide Pel transporter PelG [Eubacteriaceae bacterium ES3]
MAGIGFELKRIFKQEGLSSILAGAAYSTLVVIGPTIMVMLTLLILYATVGYLKISYTERELLSSTILYIFVFGLIITGPINAVMSRYIADKFYEEKYEDILPSYYMGLLICMVIGAISGGIFCYRLITVGELEIVYVAIAYLMFMALITVFYSLTYLSATKDYKIIAMDFLIGMILAFVSVQFLRLGFGLTVRFAMLAGLLIGFSIIATLQMAYIRHYFVFRNKNYMECLGYFKNFKRLFFGTLFYTLGIYVHNFVFWTTPEHLVIADSFVTYQAYDMAACLGMFTSISAMVIFTVMAETNFHEIYQKYIESVIGDTLENIELNKRKMFRLLVQQIGYVVRVQAVISIVIFLLAIVFLPDYGFTGLEMTMYPALSAAFFGIFIMYCNIIFLYYFNDNTGTFMTGLIFLSGVLVGSLITKNLEPQFYGLGAFAGALLGWTYSFFRIRYLEKNFDYHIMCNSKIFDKKRKKTNVTDGLLVHKKDSYKQRKTSNVG